MARCPHPSRARPLNARRLPGTRHPPYPSLAIRFSRVCRTAVLPFSLRWKTSDAYNLVVHTWMPSDPPSICQERSRRLHSYRDAATNYAEKVRELTELAIAGRESESNDARRMCRLAWDTAESSRLALSRHEADHACAQGRDFRSAEDLDSR